MDTMTTLRQILRTGTADSHARVDDLISRHDLTRPDGLAAFLSINHLAYSWLAGTLRPYAGFTAPPLPLADIEGDLATLGMPVPVWRNAPAIKANHPVGLIYVVAGSRLGGTILHKRWRKGGDPHVQRAGRFLNQMTDRSCWTAFLEQVSAAHIGQPERNEIVASANACFSVFEAACREMTKETAYGPPQPRD